MKNKKMNEDIIIFLIIGFVFTLNGTVFLGVAISTFFSNLGAEMILFTCIFGGIGLVLFIVGIICLYFALKKRKHIKRLLSDGKYVMAEIVGVGRSYNVKIWGYHPYVVTCQYQDISGDVHMFKSRYLRFNPEPLLKDQMVRVYVDAEDYNYYYVDIDEVLPNIIEH